MSLSIESFSNIKNPKFADDSGYRIDITVDIESIGTDIPFTASFGDSESYGHQLYEAALNGEYGEVAPYIVGADTVEQVEYNARSVRNSFIANTDAMTIPDYTINDEYLTDEQRQELLDTRLAFKKWPETENWPNAPLPEVPEWIINELVKKGLGAPQWTYNG
ncbi:hypothetical protein DQK58_09880 [Salmonella enterica subsp. enterica serovar Mississippi]|nr:hypothetical protein [Salmonella enterica]EBW9544346.1 hypothetical protein [Salmonella enterica subsp. enterica serovar Mississippi]EGF8155487.1 hypothetical protein [Salmonella enterica subsp. enterica serovar Enteritidis]EBO1314149.1 hypothetical protein [Salmonella enterica]EHA8559124.1 hypothetical protein [Salmonella enterica]